MRVCPKCKRRFPDNTLFCPDDGKSLVHRVEDTATADANANANAAAAHQRPGRRPSPTPTRRDMPPQPDRTSPAAPIDPNNLINQSLFGEYTITKKLGEGGMGAVYLAKQNSIDQKIAVKVLHQHAADNVELVKRFHREAHVVSMLTHPNIIRVFIFGRTNSGLLYLAMEFVKGQSLRERLDRQMLDELTAIKIMKQLCSGLSEAHDLGIIHRDLKPDNVLLTEFRGESNFVKILDFGIAKLKHPDGEEEAQKLTQAGIVYGTPEYLSPEQAQAAELDQRTDIYSLGAMLYEMMTGRVPFQSKTPVQILTAHVFNEPVAPSTIAPDRVSPTMENIILKCLAKDREDRFQNAMEMFEALVRREQELVRDQGLDGRAGYVPGMELTGMYNALSFQENHEDPTELMQGPPPALIEDARRRANQLVPDTTPLSASSDPSNPPNTSINTSNSPNPHASANSQPSSMRTLIYILIGISGLALLGMLATIAFLLLN